MDAGPRVGSVGSKGELGIGVRQDWAGIWLCWSGHLLSQHRVATPLPSFHPPWDEEVHSGDAETLLPELSKITGSIAPHYRKPELSTSISRLTSDE